jgi:hypothetical protein
MRLMIAALFLSVAIPEADAAGNKGQCKSRCDSSYQFCLNRATTKNAKKSCKADHKTCKSSCR